MRVPTAFALAVLAVYAAAALYPFRWAWPTEPNLAAYSPAGGVRFAGPGMVRSDGPPPWLAAAQRLQRLDIALQVRSFSVFQGGPARILTLSLDPHHRNFTVAQDREDLILRLRTPRTNLNGRPAHRVAGVFRDAAWKDLRVRIEPGRLTIGVDGAPALTAPLPEAPLDNWDPTYRLAMGNELTVNRPWRGEVRRALVRVGDTAVDYAAPGTLFAPGVFWRGEVPQLTPFRNVSPGDAALNFFGFIPLGLLFAVWLRRGAERSRRRLAALVALVALASLTLEILQLCFAERYASVNDLILNTAGGAAGLFLMDRLRRQSA